LYGDWGSTLAEAWNGSKWTIEATPDPLGVPYSYLWGVSCSTSPTACTAAGQDYGGKGGKYVTLVEIST
jgi:hypothetical protein